MRTYQADRGPVARTVHTAAAGTTVSLSLLAVNALGYLLTVLAARLLVPDVFGELAALLGITMIGTVPAGALQAAVALRAARTGGSADVAAGRRRMHLLGVVTSAATALAVVVAAPVLGDVLHLPVGAVLGVGALLLPTTLVAAFDGILQGERRMPRLALLLFAFGAAKTAGGIAGLLLAGTPGAVLAGMACGAAAGTAATWAGCGRPGLERGIRGPGADVVRAAGSVLGFVVLWNLDLLLARAMLPAPEAGLYAVGSVIFKIAFWLPQGIGVMALPRLADAHRRTAVLTRALVLVAGIGTPLVVAVAVAGPLVTGLLCGRGECAPVAADGWLFALLGTLMAAGQLIVWSGVARRDTRTTLTVWAVAALECAGAAGLAGTGSLTVRTLCLVATAAAVLLVGSEAARGPAADRADRIAQATAGTG